MYAFEIIDAAVRFRKRRGSRRIHGHRPVFGVSHTSATMRYELPVAQMVSGPVSGIIDNIRDVTTRSPTS
jgi:hypothetical protein